MSKMLVDGRAARGTLVIAVLQYNCTFDQPKKRNAPRDLSNYAR